MILHEHLTDRQKDVLRSLVQCFIDSAIPVASSHLTKHFFVDLSPATIRNVMAVLEKRGYIDHPHTSAGRIPTDLGYREYVDNLMQPNELSRGMKKTIEERLGSATEADEVLQMTSRMLSKISHQLSIVSAPQTSLGRLEKLELVQLSTTRVLVVLTMFSGIVKTIAMEVADDIPREKLDNIARRLNERLAGYSLKEIRDTVGQRVGDLRDEETGIIRLIIVSSKKLFDETRDYGRLHVSGTKNIVEQPEFKDPHYARSVIEILENEELIVHLLEQVPVGGVWVTIGSENGNKQLEQYSLVVSTYRIGDVPGMIGLIGPKRMNYARAVPLVEYAARSISNALR